MTVCPNHERKQAPGDSDQGISLGPGGKGLALWGRGASGGMSQSMMGSTPSQESRGSNRYQLLEDSDSGMHEPSKAPFGGRSSLGGQPSRGQDYRTMHGATKSAMFPPNGERDRSIDSRTQPSGKCYLFYDFLAEHATNVTLYLKVSEVVREVSSLRGKARSCVRHAKRPNRCSALFPKRRCRAKRRSPTTKSSVKPSPFSVNSSRTRTLM